MEFGNFCPLKNLFFVISAKISTILIVEVRSLKKMEIFLQNWVCLRFAFPKSSEFWQNKPEMQGLSHCKGKKMDDIKVMFVFKHIKTQT